MFFNINFKHRWIQNIQQTTYVKSPLSVTERLVAGYLFRSQFSKLEEDAKQMQCNLAILSYFTFLPGICKDPLVVQNEPIFLNGLTDAMLLWVLWQKKVFMRAKINTYCTTSFYYFILRPVWFCIEKHLNTFWTVRTSLKN